MAMDGGWVSPYDCLRRLHSIEKGNPSRRDRALATLFMRIGSGVVMMPDGVAHHVDSSFLRKVTSVSPFRHEYFDIYNGSTVYMNTILDDFFSFPAQNNASPIGLIVSIIKVTTAVAVAFLIIMFALLAFQKTIFYGPTYPLTSIAIHMGYSEPTTIASAIAFIVLTAVIGINYFRERRIKTSFIKPLLNGRVLLPAELVASEIRSMYGDASGFSVEEKMKTIEDRLPPEPTSGRPRHPAFEWYAKRGFSRSSLGLSMKELQGQMPKDEKGNPPSETTIRDWEREFLARKPPAETP